MTMRQALRRVVYSQSSTTSIAAGVALGIFVGMLPIVGIQMIVAALLATLFRISRVAAILPVWVTNPLTIVPIYYSQYLVGAFLLRDNTDSDVPVLIQSVLQKFEAITFADFSSSTLAALSATGDLGTSILLPLLLGSVIFATTLATVSYFITLQGVRMARSRRSAVSAHKAQLRMEQLDEAGLLPSESETMDSSLNINFELPENLKKDSTQNSPPKMKLAPPPEDKLAKELARDPAKERAEKASQDSPQDPASPPPHNEAESG